MQWELKAIGAAMGIATLATAGTVAFAQSSGSTSSLSTTTGDPAACSLALDAQSALMAAFIDRRSAAEKEHLQTRTNTLKQAIAITDATERETFLRDAHEAAHEEMRTDMEAMHTNMQEEMEAVRTACGDLLPMMKMGGHSFGKGLFMKHHGLRGFEKMLQEGTTSSDGTTSSSI